jgi:GntR family transcriptional regulator, rspAB operon transcriptional repressor
VSDPSGNPRKADQAYARLHGMITRLELEPNAFIDERELMEQLDIGRTPLREAIQRLIHEGLIVHIPRRGSWVSPLSFTDLQHMLEARRLLELGNARLAATRITPEQIAALREQVARTETEVRDGDPSSVVRTDRFFHTTLAVATGNRYLVRAIEQLQHELVRYWYVSAIQVGDLGPTIDHHNRIIDTLETGDPDAAERVMDEHMTLFQERLSSMVATPRTLIAAGDGDGNHRY